MSDRGWRQEIVEEDIDEGARPCPRELRDHAAVAERLDCGNAADRVFLGETLIRIDVHLREQDGAVPRLDGGLEHRSESVTRAAPLRPEVDYHRCVHRPLDDIVVERALGYLERCHLCSAMTTSAPQPAIRAAGTCSASTPASERWARSIRIGDHAAS